MTNNYKSAGWFAVHRGEDFDALLEHHPDALLLLFQIASRARFTPCVIRGLDRGEAFIGDFKKAGLTEQRYRTAKGKLEKFGFATFRTTNRGTIAKLAKPTVCDPLSKHTKGQSNDLQTGSQQAANEQATTNKKDKKGRRGESNNISSISPDRQTSADGPDSKSEFETEFVTAWNALPKPIRKVRGRIPQASRSAFKARCRDSDFIHDWREAMDAIPTDEHCMGDNERGWVATLEYFLRPGTTDKLLSRKAGRDCKSKGRHPNYAKEL